MRSSLIKNALFGVVMFTTGCVSTTTTTASTVKVEKAEDELEVFYELGELPGQKLEAGDCGLFLFASRPEPRFVFFAEASKGTAKVILNEKPTTLIRGDSEGDVLDLHFTEQVYVSPLDGVEMKVTINEATTIDGGSQISKASIRISSVDGWKMVIPVGGATSCVSS